MVHGGRTDCARPPCRGLFGNCVQPSHGLALNGQYMRVVNDSVADRIGQRRVIQKLMPAGDVKLGAEYGGRHLAPRLNQLQQIPGFAFLQRIQEPFVQNEQ